MKQIKDHIQYILDNGIEKPGRAGDLNSGDASLSVFSRQLRFDLREGLPFTTSKKLQIVSMLKELTWMLRGETNVNTLGSKIWDKWSAQEDVLFNNPLPEGEVIRKLLEVKPELNNPVEASGWLFQQLLNHYEHNPELEDIDISTITDATMFTPDLEKQINWEAFDKFLNDLGVPTKSSLKAVSKGDCGPIYGEQWRRFQSVLTYNGQKGLKEVDQLLQVWDLLNSSPDSRRIIVDSWNPGLVPESDKSITANITLGHMGLPPCHMLFQFWTGKRHEDGSRDLSLNLRLRSSDTGLGLGFNIGAYACILHLYALEFNMRAHELVVDTIDTHIYKGHIDGLKQYINNPEHPLATFTLDKEKYEAIKEKVIDQYLERIAPTDEERDMWIKRHKEKVYQDTVYARRSRFEILLNNITHELFTDHIENYVSEPHLELPLYD